MPRSTATAHADAEPEAVWQLVADHAGMSAWTGGGAVRLEREGDPPPNGVGAIRAVETPGGELLEQITAFEPPHRLAYTLLSGAPVSDYNGEVRLAAADGGGTDIVWSAGYEELAAGVQDAVDATLRSLADALAAEAGRRSG